MKKGLGTRIRSAPKNSTTTLAQQWLPYILVSVENKFHSICGCSPFSQRQKTGNRADSFLYQLKLEINEYSPYLSGCAFIS
jgi:hypothetical protein